MGFIDRCISVGAIRLIVGHRRKDLEEKASKNNGEWTPTMEIQAEEGRLLLSEAEAYFLEEPNPK